MEHTLALETPLALAAIVDMHPSRLVAMDMVDMIDMVWAPGMMVEYAVYLKDFLNQLWDDVKTSPHTIEILIQEGRVSAIWVEFTSGENASFVGKINQWLLRNRQWEMMEKCHFSIFERYLASIHVFQ